MTSTPSRRALLRSAAFSTVAAAIPATIATAIGATPALAEAPDPIWALLAERDRLRVLSDVATAHRHRIEAAWPTLRQPWIELTHDAKAQRRLDLERSGWNRADAEEDAILDKACDCGNAIMLCATTTRAGTLVRMAFIKEHAELDRRDIYDRAILSVFDDFALVLAGKAVPS